MKVVKGTTEIIGSNTVLKYLLIFLIVFYPILFIFQDGDLTDVGYIAKLYQDFFDNLANGNIILTEAFLSQFIGAVWLKLFPNFGILGLKFLYLLCLYSVLGILFIVLKKVAKNQCLLLFGLFCGIVFCTRYWAFLISYDDISWFFLILTGFFVIKGLDSGNNLWLFISGVVTVFAVLSRIPNIVFVLLMPIFLVYNNLYKSKSDLSKYFILSVKQFTLFVLGVISSLVVVVFLFNYLNIYTTFIANLDLFGNLISATNTSSYSILNLLKKYGRDGILFFPHLLSIVSLMVTTSSVYEYSKTKNSNLPIVVLIVVLFVTAIIVYRGFSYSSQIKFLVPAFCILPLLMSLIQKDRYSQLVALFMLLMITQVAGTNTGLFLKPSSGFMVLIPLSLLVLAEREEIDFGTIKIYTRPIIIVGVSFILFFSILVRVGWIYHVDSGIGCRFRAIYTIDHKKMKGILTTKGNALHIEQLSNAIEKNIDSNKNLFIYGQQPLFYYLTNTGPPVKKFWLGNNYVQIDELFISLEQSIKSTGIYPTIVDTKEEILGDEGQGRFERFLNEQGYKCKERAEIFDIWIK